MIEKRRRDRINRCLNELGKTVPMALAKQVIFAVLGTLHCHSPWGPRTLRTQLALGNSPLSGELGASILLAGPLQKTECGPTWVSGWWDTASFLPPLQSSGKLEKAEILEMTVQYLRALHSADFPRGREKGGQRKPGQGACATRGPGAWK